MNELTPYLVRLPSAAGQDMASVPVDALGEMDARPGLQYYWLVIRKHQWVIASFFVGTLLAAALVLVLTPRTYTAATTLLIERNTPQILDFREVLAESRGAEQYDFHKTQYEILKSRSLAARVIQAQQLEANPGFTGRGLNGGFAAELWAQATGWVPAVSGRIRRFFSPLPQDDERSAGAEEPTLIETYLGMLDILPTQKTQLVRIAFSTPDARLSADLANAHAQAYIRHGLDLRSRTNEEAQRFLEERLVELKERVEKSEAALNRYRRNKGIISLDDKENIVVERLADLNKRLTEAEAERIALEGQVRLLRGGSYGSLPAVVDNALIQNLTAEAGRLEGEYAQLSILYRPGHPRLDQVGVQLEEIRRRLNREIQKVTGSIRSAYQATVAKEKQLRATMEAQKASAMRLKDASVHYAILAREVDTNRQLYDSVLHRMKETGVAAELRTSNVSIIDKAEPPRTASSPKIKQSLLLATLLGLIGGVGCALLRERLDDTMKTPQEVERYLRLPSLGVMPDFRMLGWRRHAQRKPIHATPKIPNRLHAGERRGLVPSGPPLLVITEAYRTLRTAILLSRAEEPPKTILFTSATHGEGKTATAVNSAIIFAQMGVQVLLIDADLRRPQCHEVLGVENTLGLSELLAGHRGMGALAQPTYAEGLSFLSSGSTPPNPAELVGSRAMREILVLLREHYEYILIDTPPVMSVSDAVLLSTMVDGVVLVVDSQQTPRQVVREARGRLSYARANILGAMLNRVDLRHGDYAYYYGGYEGNEERASAATPGG
jgi:succinoglycan biosynthesis transport protein ExoP